jgi:hypothetical protein
MVPQGKSWHATRARVHRASESGTLQSQSRDRFVCQPQLAQGEFVAE